MTFAILAALTSLVALFVARDVVLRVLADRREERAVRPDAPLHERVHALEQRVANHHAALIKAQNRGIRA